MNSWHAMDVEDVLRALDSNEKGLSSGEASRRLKIHGYNELIERRRITPLGIFVNQFKDIFVIMLLISVLISILIGWYKSAMSGADGSLEEYVDAITIGAIVILNATVGFIQEYRAEKAIEAMKKLAAPKARVLRDGNEVIIPAREVVPGDVVIIETGDKIPADARLMQVFELRTEEAALTGESTPVDKITEVLEENVKVPDRRNMVFMGTHSIYGRGKAIITATGMNTEFGKIAEMVQEVEEEETPLKRKLGQFASGLAKVIIVIVAIVFLLELIEEGTRIENIMDAFMTAVALAVSAVPEGLPAVVTVTLALGARELAKRDAITRRLSSAETLGSVTYICSDKTGTLTKGEMTVRKIWIGGKMIEVTGVGYEPKGVFLSEDREISADSDGDLKLALKVATLCNNAQYGGKTIIGDTTEGALLVAAAKAGMDKRDLDSRYPRIHEVPFTSERKMMTTVHETPEDGLLVCAKGAPEILIDHCSKLMINGEIRNLDKDLRDKVIRGNEEMAAEALRVLGLAFKSSDNRDVNFVDEELERDLIFLGLMGMIDPPREEAKLAVVKCREAGIKPVMITGDHKLTAVAVARDLGILNGGMVLTPQELDPMSDEEFENIVENVTVYARVSPEHKIRIVKALKKKGHIVAMTGDGVNDAPALKQADVGVAMGITGTDVTKEAADIVLADDNFATIVNAVEGGRTIYDNVIKFSFFLLRCNFDELAIIGTFAILGLELPLTAGMILWINLVTDGGPAVALTMDPPADDVMTRPPRDPRQGILHGRVASILATMVTQFLGTAVLFYIAYYIFGEPIEEARSLAFVQATLQELVIVWNCRSEKKNAFKVGFTSNKFLLLAVIVSAALTVMVPYTGLLGTAPMTLFDWALVVPISLSGFLILPEIFYGRKVWKWT